MTPGHRFGGQWTQDKLRRLEKYLRAYMQIMKDKPFKVAYIDAFAGTGYHAVRHVPAELEQPLFEPFAEQEAKEFLGGSATIALEVEPPFHRYIFIERKSGHISELESLKTKYPERAPRIEIKQGDANQEIQALCAKTWRSRRAVLFLDPYGMQVNWETIEAVAKTQAIDLWILFPSAIGVNRLLTRSGKISPGWKRRLDLMLGSDDWLTRFYVTETERDLFGPMEVTRKQATIDAIGTYFIERLRTVFPGVADNPLPLNTPNGRPLYLLCFAAANKRGAQTAIKIAQDILKR